MIDTLNLADIERSLKETREPSPEETRDILEKARELKGLTIEESLKLLLIKDSESQALLFHYARKVKEQVFGKRIVLFAPLYLSNYCVNNCLYCGFRRDNLETKRRALNRAEALKEARHLEEKGFKRILLVVGEDNRQFNLRDLIETVETLYGEAKIRILHVNAPPMDIEDLRQLRKAGVGVFQVFQETYHRPTYEIMHPSGRKKNFSYRLEVMDRALKAGFEDVGIGTLLGLFDHRFDVLAIIAHSHSLMERFGTHAHTISVPRLRPASGVPLQEPPYPISDEEFKRIVAVYRLAVPSAGIVVSTREGETLRKEIVHLGASQISAGSKTDPGGYTRSEGHETKVKCKTGEQFKTSDHRSLEEVIASIAKDGLLPSLCTTCYRVGRTGSTFTHKTLSGDMERFCHANALLTLQEYLVNHTRDGLRDTCERAIKKGLLEIEDRRMREQVQIKLKEIEKGKKDLYF